MDRKKVFNDLIEFYGKLCHRRKINIKFWQKNGKNFAIWKILLLSKSAVEAKKKEWKQLNLTQGRENIAKFFTFPKTKATTTKAASAPTETSANITEVDFTSTTELEVSSEDSACLPVPEVLYDNFFGFKMYVVLRNQISCIVKYTLFYKNQ